MSNQEVYLVAEEKPFPIRDVISLIFLVIGTILLTIGVLLAWGVPGMLICLGVISVIVSLAIGWNR